MGLPGRCTDCRSAGQHHHTNLNLAHVSMDLLRSVKDEPGGKRLVHVGSDEDDEFVSVHAA